MPRFSVAVLSIFEFGIHRIAKKQIYQCNFHCWPATTFVTRHTSLSRERLLPTRGHVQIPYSFLVTFNCDKDETLWINFKLTSKQICEPLSLRVACTTSDPPSPSFFLIYGKGTFIFSAKLGTSFCSVLSPVSHAQVNEKKEHNP